MTTVSRSLHELRSDWRDAKHGVHRGVRTYSPLACILADRPASEAELADFPLPLPLDVRDFWLETEWADLFKDQQYGQWGLRLHSPLEAIAEKTLEVREARTPLVGSDLVLGRFYGDSELLLIRCDLTASDHGAVTVALPVYGRREWPIVAPSFEQFLSRYIRSDGDKYWED